MYTVTINKYKQFFQSACKKAISSFHKLTDDYVNTYKKLEDDADDLKVAQYNVYDEYFEENFTKPLEELEDSISLLKDHFKMVCDSCSNNVNCSLTINDDYSVINDSYNEHLSIYNSLLDKLNNINLDSVFINENSKYSDIFKIIDKNLIKDIFSQYHFLHHLLILISEKINKDFDILNNENNINQAVIDEEIKLENKLKKDIFDKGNEIFRNDDFLFNVKDFVKDLDTELDSIGQVDSGIRLTNIEYKLCDKETEIFLLRKFLPEIGERISDSGHILIPFTLNMRLVGNIFYINTVYAQFSYKPFIDSLLVHYLYGYPLNKIHLHLFDGDNLMSFSRYIPLKSKLAELDICRDKKIMNLHLNDIRNVRFAQEDFLVEKGYKNISEYNSDHPDDLMDIHITVFIGFDVNIDKKTLDESTELLFFSSRYGMFSIIEFSQSAFFDNKKEIFDVIRGYMKVDSFVFYGKDKSIHSAFLNDAVVDFDDGYDLDTLINDSEEGK